MNFSITFGNKRFSIGAGNKKKFKNSYDAAQVTRLTNDWLLPQTSADAEIGKDITTLRGRARQLERNNEYVQRYLTLLENNVLGANGVGLQMKIVDPSGQPDKLANKAVKDAWIDWTQRDLCDISGKMCWREIEGITLRRTAADGGGMLRIIRDATLKYGFALEIFEIDRLDVNLSCNLTNGNFIRFGIEFNRWQRPIAYHLWKSHPGDGWTIPLTNGGERERVLAQDIIHTYWIERPGQSIGVPWIACVMQAIEHLGKYKEAELVAARVHACAGMFLKQPMPDNGYSGERDPNGEPLQEMSPGMAILGKPGEELQVIDPSHPNQNFGGFITESLRGIAAGLEVGYMSLANDPSDANYSSMRGAKLEEVETYKGIQSWLIESLHERVFKEWLTMALAKQSIKISGTNALPLSKFDKFNAPDWKPRRWPWVDPQKDLNAAILSVEKGFKSRREIIAEMGGDIEEVFAEQEADELLAEEHDLEFPIGTNPQPPQEEKVEQIDSKEKATNE